MCTCIYKHIHHCKKFTDCPIDCTSGNREVIKYNIFISEADIELSVRCRNTGSEDMLAPTLFFTCHLGPGERQCRKNGDI